MYDEAEHLLGEYDGAGALIQETVWLGDIPVATLRPAGAGGVSVYYVHTDHLNTPRRISRPSDNVIVWRWDSDPFGTTPASEDPDGDSTPFVYHLRFPGQYFDAESGLHYNYFRDYDPTIGRYVQSDPIGLESGINTYAYVQNNPMAFVDPEGLAAVGPLPLPVPVPRPVPLPAIPRPFPGTVDPVLPIPVPEPVTVGRGRYRCVVRCNVQEITTAQSDYDGDAQVCATGNCPPYVKGVGFGSTPAEAFANAKLAANAVVPRHCYKRHCHGVEGSCKNWK